MVRSERPDSIATACGTLRLLLALAMLLCLTPGPAQTTDPLGDNSKRLERVREHIEALLQTMESTKDEQGGLNRRLQQSEREIGNLARGLRALSDRLQRQRQQLADLRSEEDAALGRLDRLRTALARQIRTAYVIGRQERLQLLLNQQDPARLSRALTYYDYFNRARAQQMSRINRRLDELAAIRAGINREEQRLNALLDRQRDELAALEQTRAERLAVVRELGVRLQDQGQQLDRLRRNEQRLQALIREIEQALLDIPAEVPGQQSFSERKGRLTWPVSGRLGASFGTKKAGSLEWDGVLIRAEEGREVKAVYHGRVAFADWLRGFGLLVIIDHGDGWMTLYGHNQSLFKEVGEWVQTGEPVALVGNSGGRSEAGVYFGIRHKGVAVDPQRWCRKIQGRRVS